ncbi:hypothetical protein CW304_07405 [Bacillus sp. UFRGS-B20]|nr:hypothetical protein CW304_07405 [Bacillus sp. UFRGS-B20]
MLERTTDSPLSQPYFYIHKDFSYTKIELLPADKRQNISYKVKLFSIIQYIRNRKSANICRYFMLNNNPKTSVNNSPTSSRSNILLLRTIVWFNKTSFIFLIQVYKRSHLF